MSVTTQMEAWRESNDDCLPQKALEDRKWMAKKMSSLKRDLLTELESQMTDLQTEWRMNNNVLRDKVFTYEHWLSPSDISFRFTFF